MVRTLIALGIARLQLRRESLSVNYRHHFHAGNFADVMKHALFVLLVRAMQRKETGFLILDTHAGRGGYDLERASRGDSLERQPEWPDGIGRLWKRPKSGGPLEDYLALVRAFNRSAGGPAGPRYYPGSPGLALRLARPQDRLALCEIHPMDHAALRRSLHGEKRVSVHAKDGYGALRAMLPPPEKRALILIDPPFENKDEWKRIAEAVRESLTRFPKGVYAIWYPLTARAGAGEFFRKMGDLKPPPTLAAELSINPGAKGLEGCGLLVINPPWQFETEAAPLLADLAAILAQAPGAQSRLLWLVRE
jgi:23S rRNA (adenine2030-N6)-methyltransferase